jgi:ferredoxin
MHPAAATQPKALDAVFSNMPTVEYDGEEIDCASGERLRDVLLAVDASVHNGPRAVSCHGHGSCGTCAVEIGGDAGEPPRRERLRLSIPPHDPDSGLRLACQVRVTDDLAVEKHDGFWGEQKRTTES